MITPGTRLSSYEIVASLGEGGMGEVYRARDTKLGREVAIKVLPDATADDDDRVARFEREAKALAALNHPHIAALYGMEEASGRHLLVMELVEGDTLADRLKAGPLPVVEALAIARQMADALEAAHERGIIHRDLKPANVKVTPDGKVKVLDFGLAKAIEGAPGSTHDLALSPTLTAKVTMAGVILGTAAYMSPEQAKGLPTDHRSDVFSFGCVLYELLTGRQAFPGESVTDIIASVLAREPEWTAMPATLDPRLSRLLRRCLAKSRRERLQAIGDVRCEIEFILAEPAPSVAAPVVVPSPPARPWWKHALAFASVAVIAGVLAGMAVWMFRPAPPPPPTIRFTSSISTDAALFTNFNRQVIGVSRDGSQVAFGADRLYIRRISELALQPVPGTEAVGSVTHPVFSPDGGSIVFWAASDRSLKRVTLGSRGVMTVCALTEGGLGLHWAGDDIYFGDHGRGIKRVSANGGKVDIVVPIVDREELYGPQLLADGDTLIFTVGTRGITSWDRARIVAQSLRSGKRTTLVEGATDGRYVASGHLLFGRSGVLYAVPLNLETLSVVGEPVAVVEGVRRSAPATTGAVHFAVSDAGTLAYIPGPVASGGASLQLAVFDRTGGATPLNVPLGVYTHPRVSPDGSRLAVDVNEVNESSIWIYGFAKSSAARRLTFGGQDRSAVWSSDGQRVTFQSTREGDAGIWWQRADGSDTATRLTRADKDAAHTPQSWSPDGRHLLFDETRGDRVVVFDRSADGKAVPFSTLESDIPSDATFSPDGRWVVYSTRTPNGAAQAVIYLEPYPRTGARYQVSKSGEDGHHPMWSRDGREIFYTPGPGNRFVALPVTTTPAFAFGEPSLIPRPFLNSPPTYLRTYDVSPDGKGVVGLRTDVGANGLPVAPLVEVVLNWFEELKSRVPTK
jgi:serine/threonine protein kinase/Tol biopolymer transport system component